MRRCWFWDWLTPLCRLRNHKEPQNIEWKDQGSGWQGSVQVKQKPVVQFCESSGLGIQRVLGASPGPQTPQSLDFCCPWTKGDILAPGDRDLIFPPLLCSTSGFCLSLGQIFLSVPWLRGQPPPAAPSKTRQKQCVNHLSLPESRQPHDELPLHHFVSMTCKISLFSCSLF